MARKGRAGPALGIAAFGSFIAGTMSIIGLMLVAPPLAKFALAFGPPEYFSLMLLGIVILDLPGLGVHPQGPDDVCLRAAPQHDRHGCHLRHPASDLRHPGAQRRGGPDSGDHGPLRRGRGHRQRRRGDQADDHHHQGEEPPAQPPGLEGFLLADHPRDRSWGSSSASFPGRRRSSPPSAPMPSRRSSPSIRRNSGRA